MPLILTFSPRRRNSLALWERVEVRDSGFWQGVTVLGETRKTKPVPENGANTGAGI
jgi:hypothetical protein